MVRIAGFEPASRNGGYVGTVSMFGNLYHVGRPIRHGVQPFELGHSEPQPAVPIVAAIVVARRGEQAQIGALPPYRVPQSMRPSFRLSTDPLPRANVLRHVSDPGNT